MSIPKSTVKPARIRLPNQAPSYFHWTESRPVTTNQIYGWPLREYSHRLYPERPKNKAKYVRPFDNYDFFPDYLHDWDLSGRQCRPPPLREWRPSRKFCLADTINRIDSNKGYTHYSVPARERFVDTDIPQGVHVRLPDCLPTPAYVCRKPRARTDYLWSSVPGVLVHVNNHPPPPEDQQYDTPTCDGPTNCEKGIL